MAYVTVPKDLTQVKTKFIFNLTKRQVICFGGGALAGLPTYFLTRKVLPSSLSVLCMIVIMLPFFLTALYERNGEPLEKVLRHYVQSRFIRPKTRSYKTNNFYAAIMRQAQIDQEVDRIVYKRQKK